MTGPVHCTKRMGRSSRSVKWLTLSRPSSPSRRGQASCGIELQDGIAFQTLNVSIRYIVIFYIVRAAVISMPSRGCSYAEIVIPHTLVSERGIGGQLKHVRGSSYQRLDSPSLAFGLSAQPDRTAEERPAGPPACVSHISNMTFAFDNRVGGMTAPQALQARGEHNLFFQSTDPALHACCPSLPGWLILNSAGGAVMTLQMPIMAWICCAGGFMGDDLDGMNWGQLMLLDTKLDVMWGTYITLGLDFVFIFFFLLST